MATFPCPECDGVVSEYAAACPHCGCPQAKLDELRVLQVEVRTTGQSPEVGEVQSSIQRKMDSSPFRSLQDYLVAQLEESGVLTDDEFDLAKMIIDDIDDNGYVTVQQLDDLSYDDAFTFEEVDFVLKRIQCLNPIGVGARCRTECLAIQADYYYAGDAVLANILRSNPRLLDVENYEDVARNMKLPIEKVKGAVRALTNLNPKPGLRYQEQEETRMQELARLELSGS